MRWQRETHLSLGVGLPALRYALHSRHPCRCHAHLLAAERQVGGVGSRNGVAILCLRMGHKGSLPVSKLAGETWVAYHHHH